MVRAISAALVTLTLSACSGSSEEVSTSTGTQAPISVGGETQNPPVPTDNTEAPNQETPGSTLTLRPELELTVHDCPAQEGFANLPDSQLESGKPELIVLGVYESRRDHGGGSHPEGTATVHVRRSVPHTLVLSSYEPTLWKIDAESGSRIDRIILNGLHPQRVEHVPPNVKVIDRSGPGFMASCAWRWPGDDQGCETQHLVSELRKLTSQEITAFAGCYRATEFTVGEAAPREPTPPSTPKPPNNPNPPGAVKHTANCTPGQGKLTTYVAPSLAKSELHLLGVYESHSNHGNGEHPAGSATVDVNRTAPLILALSSYEPIHWTVKAVPGARIERIILNGYHPQSVTAPEGIPIDNRSGSSHLGAYGYAWPSSTGGSDTPSLVARLEELTSRPLSSFAGCYQGSAFQLE